MVCVCVCDVQFYILSVLLVLMRTAVTCFTDKRQHISRKEKQTETQLYDYKNKTKQKSPDYIKILSSIFTDAQL